MQTLAALIDHHLAWYDDHMATLRASGWDRDEDPRPELDIWEEYLISIGSVGPVTYTDADPDEPCGCVAARRPVE